MSTLPSQIAADPTAAARAPALRSLRFARAICPSATSHLLRLSSLLLYNYSSKDK
jgi:hypothetical protein